MCEWKNIFIAYKLRAGTTHIWIQIRWLTTKIDDSINFQQRLVVNTCIAAIVANYIYLHSSLCLLDCVKIIFLLQILTERTLILPKLFQLDNNQSALGKLSKFERNMVCDRVSRLIIPAYKAFYPCKMIKEEKTRHTIWVSKENHQNRNWAHSFDLLLLVAGL